MKPCGFSYGHYREALEAALARGYAFAAFDEAPGRGACVLLRHDVDFSVERALPLARIEAELGLVSTFFVLPHGRENLFGAPALPLLREILGLGHRLGLHYDLAFYAASGLPPSQGLRREAAQLEAALGAPVRVAAEHNPGRAPGPPGFEPGPLLDAYAPAFTRDMKYLSDSCQHWREGCFCRFLDPERCPRVQVLVHPIWWSQEGRTADAALRAHTEGRIAAAREDERRIREHYASLAHLPNREQFLPGKT